MHADNFNSLGRALALAGVSGKMAATQTRAAWLSRPLTRTERFKQALFNAECRAGHRLSKGAALRKIKLKPKRTF